MQSWNGGSGCTLNFMSRSEAAAHWSSCSSTGPGRATRQPRGAQLRSGTNAASAASQGTLHAPESTHGGDVTFKGVAVKSGPLAALSPPSLHRHHLRTSRRRLNQGATVTSPPRLKPNPTRPEQPSALSSCSFPGAGPFLSGWSSSALRLHTRLGHARMHARLPNPRQERHETPFPEPGPGEASHGRLGRENSISAALVLDAIRLCGPINAGD